MFARSKLSGFHGSTIKAPELNTASTKKGPLMARRQMASLKVDLVSKRPEIQQPLAHQVRCE